MRRPARSESRWPSRSSMMVHDNRSIRQAYGVDRAPDDKTAAWHRLFQLQGSGTRIGQARAGGLQDPEDHPDDVASSQYSRLTRPALSGSALPFARGFVMRR